MKFYIQILIVCLLYCFFSISLNAQNTSLYPGDVNDNGIANHVDLLYIGSAFGEAGNARVDYAYTFTSNVSGGTPPYSYAWSSTNGFTSSEANPSFIFEAIGNYTICVEVTDAVGTINNSCSTIAVGQDEDCGFFFDVIPDTLDNTYQFTIDSFNVQNIAFEWSFGDNTISNLSNPTHTFPAEGIYTVCLNGVNMQGEICSRCIDLNVSNDSTDLFTIIQPSFSTVLTENLSWQEQPTPLFWNSFFNNGNNYAFADCDGDGFIDDLDVNVLEQNYGLTHGTLNSDIFITGMVETDPIISLDETIDTLQNPEGMTVELPIILGEMTNPINNFYGIAFTIEYEPAYVIGDSVQIDFLLNSWINPSNSGLISIQSNDPVNGLIEASISRINQTTVNGFGEIGKVSFIIEDNLVGALQMDDNEVFDIRIRDVKMVNETVEDQPIASQPYSLFLDTSTSTDVLTKNNLTIYPNPASNLITIHSENTNINNIELRNVSGQQIVTPMHQNGSLLEINTNHIPSGIYFLKIETYNSLITQKIIIQKN